MTTTTAPHPATATPTGWGRRVVLVLVTLLPALLFAGALAELTAGTDDGIHRFHDFTHAVWVLLLVCLPYALQWHRPQAKVALWQGAAVGAALLVAGGSIAGVADPVFYVAFPLFAALVALTHPARGQLLRRGEGLSPVLAPLAALAAVPASIYASDQLGLQRTLAADPHGKLTHYAAQGIAVLFVVVVAAVASLRTPGWQWAAGLATTSGLLLGVGSLVGSGQTGAWSSGTSAAILALSLGYGAAAMWEHRRG